MKIQFKISGPIVDKPLFRTVEVDDDKDAVQLPDGTIMKVNMLYGDALEQYIYEKFVNNSAMAGRVLEYTII